MTAKKLSFYTNVGEYGTCYMWHMCTTAGPGSIDCQLLTVRWSLMAVAEPVLILPRKRKGVGAGVKLRPSWCCFVRPFMWPLLYRRHGLSSPRCPATLIIKGQLMAVLWTDSATATPAAAQRGSQAGGAASSGLETAARRSERRSERRVVSLYRAAGVRPGCRPAPPRLRCGKSR